MFSSLPYTNLLGFTGFYGVLRSFMRYYWVLLGFTEFYKVILGFTGFYWVLLNFIEFSRVPPSYNGLYSVVWGFTVSLNWALTRKCESQYRLMVR